MIRHFYCDFRIKPKIFYLIDGNASHAIAIVLVSTSVTIKKLARFLNNLSGNKSFKTDFYKSFHYDLELIIGIFDRQYDFPNIVRRTYS